MSFFIRLDIRGEWKGNAHCSSSGVPEETCLVDGVEFVAETGEYIPTFEERAMGNYEKGISCYELTKGNIGEAINNLYDYWYKVACLTDLRDYDDYQVTIFRGERVRDLNGLCYGVNDEDLAYCEETILETDARCFMEKVFIIVDQYEDSKNEEWEISEEEYFKELEQLIQNKVFNFLASKNKEKEHTDYSR